MSKCDAAAAAGPFSSTSSHQALSLPITPMWFGTTSSTTPMSWVAQGVGEPLETGLAAELRVDGPVVDDVVAVGAPRPRPEDRREVAMAHPERRKVGYARQRVVEGEATVKLEPVGGPGHRRPRRRRARSQFGGHPPERARARPADVPSCPAPDAAPRPSTHPLVVAPSCSRSSASRCRQIGSCSPSPAGAGAPAWPQRSSRRTVTSFAGLRPRNWWTARTRSGVISGTLTGWTVAPVGSSASRSKATSSRA